MFFKKKRAQTEQFNWIFIIFAGAVILAFFTLFTVKYIELKQLQQGIEISKDFARSINILEGMPGTGKERGVYVDDSSKVEDGGFKMGTKVLFDYECLENDSIVTFNKEPRSSQTIKKNVLFAPSQMNVDALDLWILPWNYPFFTTNFVFLSAPEVRYYFIYDGANQRFVNELFIPGNLIVQKSLIGREKIVDRENGRVVFFVSSKETAEREISRLNDKFDSVDFKQIKTDNVLKNYGEIIFYDSFGKETGKGKFYGLPLIWGGIFSDNPDVYNCAVDKAIARLKSVSDVYISKADLLSFSGKQGCSSYYDAFKISASKLAGKDFTTAGFKQNKIVEAENGDLTGKGCDYIF